MLQNCTGHPLTSERHPCASSNIRRHRATSRCVEQHCRASSNVGRCQATPPNSVGRLSQRAEPVPSLRARRGVSPCGGDLLSPRRRISLDAKNAHQSAPGERPMAHLPAARRLRRQRAAVAAARRQRPYFTACATARRDAKNAPPPPLTEWPPPERRHGGGVLFYRPFVPACPYGPGSFVSGEGGGRWWPWNRCLGGIGVWRRLGGRLCCECGECC